jgi:lysophospholipase L1-like esterase
MIKNFKWLLLVSLTFVACSTDDESVDPSSSDGSPLTAGTADFSKYVALGDSFAAGFSDNALFIEGQNGAYPNILAQQFSLVGGGAFTTPLMADNVGGFLGSSTYTPRLYLAPPTTPNGSPSPSSVALPPYSQYATTNQTTILSGSFSNMGVPGAKCIHLDYPGYGSSMGNPYFARFASNPMATIVDDAVAQNPTFFSLWIGGNDVLGYATSGGITPSDITPPSVFDTKYNSLITKLTAGGSKGVIANLPYVNTLPYFKTVPYNPVPLDAATAAQLNSTSAYGAYNYGITLAFAYLVGNGLMTQTAADAEIAKRTISFYAGSSNSVVILDEYLTDLTAINPALKSMRQATAEDLIVLPARSFIGTTVGGNPLYINGVSVPLADKWVLSKSEIAEIKAATDAYNETIAAAAANNNLAIYDARETMTQLSTKGIYSNGYTLTSNYVSGGAFSLDGVHPSPRGYALIANEFIKAINAKYGSNLKGVSLYDYRIMFPPVL